MNFEFATATRIIFGPGTATQAATEGIVRAARSLRTACTDGRNAAAREDMALASLLSGLALANAGLGAVHGFAAPIGGVCGAPHGTICGLLLPQVMEANIKSITNLFMVP